MVTWRREVSRKNDARQSCLERTVGTSGSMRSTCRVKESLSHGVLRRLLRVFPELDSDDSVFGATQPAIVALKRTAGHILTTKFGTEIVPEEASMGDGSSNGLEEHAAREAKAKARSLAHGLKRLLGQELEPTHPVVTWLIQWAAMTISIGRRGIDGKTPWEQRYGRPCRRSIAEFGEKILWLPTGKHKSHLEERYLPGVFWVCIEQ